MPEFLTSETPLECSFGDAPMPFQALPLPGKPEVMGGLLTATIEEIVPEVNIPSFVMCNSLANPEVAAATAAAMGVLTPMPCVPVVVDPWMPPSELVSFMDIPLATMESKCLCAWGGEISPVAPVEVIATTEV